MRDSIVCSKQTFRRNICGCPRIVKTKEEHKVIRAPSLGSDGFLSRRSGRSDPRVHRKNWLVPFASPLRCHVSTTILESFEAIMRRRFFPHARVKYQPDRSRAGSLGAGIAPELLTKFTPVVLTYLYCVFLRSNFDPFPGSVAFRICHPLHLLEAGDCVAHVSSVMDGFFTFLGESEVLVGDMITAGFGNFGHASPVASRLPVYQRHRKNAATPPVDSSKAASSNRQTGSGPEHESQVWFMESETTWTPSLPVHQAQGPSIPAPIILIPARYHPSRSLAGNSLFGSVKRHGTGAMAPPSPDLNSTSLPDESPFAWF
jgi:hypothetical protein